jgi:hypothetical protein
VRIDETDGEPREHGRRSDVLFSLIQSNTHLIRDRRNDMKTKTYRRGDSARLARAAVFGMLALAAVLLPSGEARAQWTQPDAQGNINATNQGSVGIGTATPEAMLHVHGGMHTTGPAAGYSFRDRSSNNAADAWVWYSSNNVARFWRPGVGDLLGVTPSGNFGIGTTSPLARLDVNGAANVWSGGRYAVSQGFMSPGSLTVGSFTANFGGGTTGWNANTAGLLLEAQDNTEIAVHDVGQRLASFMYFEGGTTNRMTIGRDMGFGAVGTVSINGSVGVGTNAPGFKFDVQGGAVNASGGLCIAGDCKTSWSQVGGASQWTTSGTNLLYNSGNVGIGTQASNTAKLVIGGTAGTEGLDLATADQYANLRVIRNSKSAHDRDLYLQYGAGTGSRIRFYTDNNETMTLAGGRLGVGTSAPVAALDVNGDIRASGNISAKYQDLAEWVPSTQKLSAGTVVVLDTRNSNHVLASTTAYDTRVAGVISAQPGIMLGEAGEGKALVATTGRVKVKVDATRAPVQIGDLIVTSDVAGVAMKSEPMSIGGRQLHAPGTIIGKALEPLEKGTGEILVLLSLQ